MSKVPKDMKDKNKFQEVMEDNPELKQLLFFGFYIVFFIFVIVLLRSSFVSSNQKTSKYNSGYGYSFNLKALATKNYHFNYKIIKNGEMTVFDGDRNGNSQSFVMSGNPSISYSSKDSEYLMRNPNTLLYEKSENPMEFSNLVQPSNLQKLFVHGSYISKTEYLNESGTDYHYEISTTTILKNVDGIRADLDDPVNIITAKIDQNKRLYEIDMDFTSYYQYFDSSITEYRLILTYSKYGEIDEIS